ncbi:MAG: hypothetical protein ACI4R6_02995 [Lachnospiraceae bacterium]
MKKIQKGKPGYFRYRKIQTGIAMASGYLLVLLLFFTGIFIFADRGNLFTVVAIVAMLPTAKMTVNFLMYPKCGKADRAEFDEMCRAYPKLTLLADIYITPEKKSVEFPYTAITRSHIIIYCPDKKLDEAYHGKYIRQFLKNDDINVDVSFYTDLNKFRKRLAAVSINEPEEYSAEEREQIGKIAYNFEIMSI